MPLQLLRGPPRRWMAFFAAILVSMVAGGSVFLFPVYSKAIKTSLGYDDDKAKALTVLALSKNLGAGLGFLPSALVYDVAPPRAVLPSVLAMILLGLASYIVPCLAVAGLMRSIARPTVWLLLCISVAVGANSQSFAMTGALVGSVSNFPGHGGPVVTLLLAFAGIGGDIQAQLARASPLAVLFMPCVCCVVLLLFTWNSIRVIPRARSGGSGVGEDGAGVNHFLGLSALAFAFLFTFHVIDLVLAHIPGPAYYVTAIVILAAVLVISLLAVAVKLESSSTANTRTAATPGEAAAGSTSTKVTNNNIPFWMQCKSILGAVFGLDMVLIFLVTLAIGGGIQTPIDMMDQIRQSLGYEHGATSKLVSLVSLLDYAGRLAGGLGSEHMLARRSLPRPAALTVAFLLACVGHLLIALGVPHGLYAAAPIMGFCIGALWTVVFVTISDVFGTKHLAVLYNLAVLPSAIGAYILNLWLTKRLYLNLNGGDGDLHQHVHTCATIECFRESLFILVGVTLFGAVVSALLALRAWPCYRAPTPIAAAAGVVALVSVDPSSSSKEDQMVVLV